MKKKIIASTLAAAGLFSAGLAQAAGADLSVKGKLRNGACSVVLGNGGVIDLGSIKAADVNVDQGLLIKPDPEPISLTITCTTATSFGLRLQDNRAGTAWPPGTEDTFGLGTVGGKNIGAHINTISNPTSNGQPTDVLQQWGEGIWWSDGSGSRSLRFYNVPEHLVSFTAVGNADTPGAFEQISAQLTSEVYITPLTYSELDLSQQVQIDGSATLELVYL